MFLDKKEFGHTVTVTSSKKQVVNTGCFLIVSFPYLLINPILRVGVSINEEEQLNF